MTHTSTILSATSNQRRAWFLEQLQPGNPVSTEVLCLRCKGKLDSSRLRATLDALLLRHEALRVKFSFEEGQLHQHVRDTIRLSLREVTLDSRGGNTQETLEKAIKQELETSVLISDEALLRATVFSLSPHEHYLLLQAHQLVADTGSLDQMAVDIARHYLEPGPVPPASSYSDFIVKVNAVASDQQESLAWWKQELLHLPNLEFASDFPRPTAPSHRCVSGRLTLAGASVDAIQRLAQQESSSSLAVVSAAFRWFLAQNSNQRDFAIGVDFSDDQRFALQGGVGPVANSLPVRLDIDPSLSLRRLLRQEQARFEEVRRRSGVHLDTILDSLRPERDMTRHPIFQAFVRVLPESRLPSSPELSFEQVHLPRSFSRFDFLLEIVLQGSILDGWLNASADLFQAATIERLAGQFERLLEQAALAPDSPLTAFSLLSEDERRQILVEWNRTEAPFPADKLLHELFEEQVARTPDACALEFEQTTLTYAQLNQAANRLARHLQRRGAAPGSFVGVALERSVELVVALFAVLKAGCAYVAIDPEYPEERVRAMLQDASPSALITQKKFTALFEGVSAPLLVLDEMVGALQAEEGSNLPRLATPDSIAYVIFTSGSTGRPKGVMNHHRGVCNRIWWMQQEYRLDASDAVLQKTPFSFDVSVWEFFWPTMAGARLVVSKPGGHRDPYYLSQVIRARNITTLHFVPSMLQLWLEAGGVDTCTSLRRVICSGEALSNEHQRKFFECSTAELHNLYGPTEAAIDVTSWRCQRDQQGHTVPIGRPISNIQLYILDERMQPVAVGFPGELYIGGVGVAAGYVNRPELTAERFLPDPFRPGGKLYRTGDVCRWRSDGVIDYLGRADFQVKIRGFRIELGEIEHAMMQHPTVGQALVIARNQGTSRQLVAYLVPRPGQQIKRAQVREFLQGKLPDYMVPSAFVTLEQMPLSPNGKADRKALPEPEMAPETRRHESTPRTEEERKLTEIWTTLLGVPTLGVHENFFECGGHSLLVMQMLFMIRTSFGEQLSVHTIFNAPTIAQLARVLAKKTISNPPPSTRIPPPDLLVDSHLTPLVSAEAVPPFEDRPAEHILVTGASGFLGAFLLHELMQQHRKKAYCLVRAASPDEALQRLRDNLERRGLWWPGMEGRIEAIPGDLGRPRFGLDEPTYQRLSSAIDAVLHNGALVDFVRPYHMLKPANVDGTVEILRFASTRKNKPVHFISTLSVFPAVKHGEDRVEREDSELDFAPTRLHGGYAQSKWVGERLCFQARERGMLINIYRPGVVLGPSGTGNAVDFFHLLVKGCLQLGLAPDLDIQFNLTPADYVAPAVIDILFAGRPGNKAYNFANPVRLRWNDLLLWLSEQGYELARCSFREWVSTLRETVENGAENALASLLYFLAEMPPEALQFPWYSTTETDAALRKTTISCTPANETLLGPWLADLQRSGFLPRPMLGLERFAL